jgi:quinol monooxygenase YgiN
MPYFRLSIARPRRGDEQRFEEVMRKLNELGAATEGCLATYLLRTHDDSGEIARLAIYENEAAAAAAANTNSFLSLRAELHLISEPGHQERAFFSD